jgi:alpha-tubulin suppressor-like RCC1 family protein
VAAGQHFGCAVVDARAMCWGDSDRGEVGDGSFQRRQLPVEVKGLVTTTVTQVSAGLHHVCALAGGEVWCWGQNASGQLGDNSRATSAQPVKVGGLPGSASQVFTGYYHSCAVVGGELWCWGSNALGELGEPWSGLVDPGPAAAWQAP